MRKIKLFTLAVVVSFLACGSKLPVTKAFPDNFLFGSAVAGFQIEAGCPTIKPEDCEDRNSDWYQWVNSKNELQDLKSIVTFEPISNGPGFWELYDQDFARAKTDMQLQSVRLSLEWSRIFPSATDGLEGAALAAAANPKALAGYHAQFAALKRQGLVPFVTLNHYTLPTWIHDGVACHKSIETCTKRGWLDKARIIKEIAKYAGFVAKEFGAEVDLWATENEPFAVVLPGYLLPTPDRVNPPGLTLRFAEGKAVMLALIEAHARMYDAVKAGDLVDADGDGQNSSVGLVYAVSQVKAKDEANRLDVTAATNLFYLYNTAFLDGVIKGEVDADLSGQPDGPARDDLKGRMDFLGVNYYTRITVAGTESAIFPTLSPLSNFDATSLNVFQDYARGIYEVLLHIKNRYQIPTYISETGTDGSKDGDKVASWMTRHLEWTKRALRDGADVRGFYVWTLMDNYEWNHGMDLRFGLYAVGTDVTKTRTARSGVAAYAEIIKARDVTPALLERYPPE
jgi:beta-galactosidase